VKRSTPATRKRELKNKDKLIKKSRRVKMNNMINYYNDFMKEMNELNTKNLEMMNKFWKAAIEQNDENIEKNITSYFGYLNTNINYLNTIWNSSVKNNQELRKTYTENMNTLHQNFTKIYKETAEKITSKMEAKA